MMEVKLPELGENIETVEVSAVLVEVGTHVTEDQPLIEVETEKANLEVPASADGTVAELLVKVGDRLAVGQVIVKLDTEASSAAQAEPEDGDEAAPEPEDGDEAAPEPEDGDEAAPEPEGGDEAAPESPEVPEAHRVEDVHQSVIAFPAAKHKPEIGPTVAAAPSVRRLARELGIDIQEVRGSGPGGRITRGDVKAHTKRVVTGMAAVASTGATAVPAPLPDFSQWGETVTEPLSNIRRTTAKNMATAWAAVPHVTQFDRADITQLESMRKRFNTRDESAGLKLTMTAIVLKMVAAALRQFPKFNASLDLANERVIYKKYVHIGVAVDTERGLLVPVIRDADRKSLVQVAGELDDLAERARDKKLSLDEMNGASFTVSNLGGLGTTYFSPIVNWPQVAILGVGRAEHHAVFAEGQFQPRLMMPLSISYDHRLIDGADAARFLRWLAEALEQPLLLLLDE
jgi:pyruvate dehydrogenase E2 component (dihydrolipoamide acetyltransferase)